MRRFRLDLVALVAVVALLPFLLPNGYWFDVTIRVGLAAIAAVGLNILMGFAGQLSIGHAGLVAAAAYVSALLNARAGVPAWLSMLAATGLVTAVSFALSRPMLRLRGFGLAIATLGLGLIIQIVLVNEVDWTGGPDGMTVNPLQVGEFTFGAEWDWYALVAATLVFAVAASLNLYRGPAGRALRALKGSEVAAQVAGVDTAAMKVRAFTAAGFFAGLSGALTAHYSGFITPDLSAFTRSVEFATMVVVGGRGSTYGVVLGACLLTVLPQLLGGTGDYEMIAFGLILTVTMVFLPQGLVPTLAGLRRIRTP